jgi:hypothetical protein
MTRFEHDAMRRYVASIAMASLAIAGLACGASGDEPAAGVESAATSAGGRVRNAIDARDYIERRLGRDPDFGCAIMPTGKTVRVIGRSDVLLTRARALVPRLSTGRLVELRRDPNVASMTQVSQVARGLEAMAPPRIVINVEGKYTTRHCPRVRVILTKPAHFNAAERALIASAQRRYPGLVISQRVEPAYAG